MTHFKSRRLGELKVRISLLRQRNCSLVMCAITGVVGCGKSELAKAYSWESPEGPHIFKWRLDPDITNNNASTVSYQQAWSALLHNFNILVRKAYDLETQEQMDRRCTSILWEKINQYSSWIVIFDNARSRTDIKDHLPLKTTWPHSQGTILITTQKCNFFIERNANFDTVNHGLDETEAIQLLKEISSINGESEARARELVKLLDYSPLCIRVAGCYIHIVDETMFGPYIDLLKDNTEEIIDRTMGADFISQAVGDDKRSATLHATLKLLIQKLEQINPDLVGLLRYCGFLANENIPLNLLSELFRQSEEDLTVAKYKLRALLTGKENYSLLTSAGEKCYLHRATQMLIRASTSSPDQVIERLVALVLKSYPFDPYSVEKNHRCREMIPHFLALNENAKLYTSLSVVRIRLLIVLGQISATFSSYSRGLEYLNEAQQLIDDLSLLDPKLQFRILERKAYIYHRLSDYKKARKNVELALQVYPIQDGRRAWGYSLLGDILMQDPDLLDKRPALNAYKAVFHICQQNTQDFDERRRQMQMGDANWGRGQYFQHSQKFLKAIAEYQKALIIFQQCKWDLGQGLCYISLGTIGLVEDPERFIDPGIEYSQAVQYVRQALEIYSRDYGPTTYHVADSYGWLSRLQYVGPDKPNWEAALDSQSRSIQILIDIFGEMYHGLAEKQHWKGRILQKLDRNLDAIDAYKSALSIEQNLQGKELDWIRKSQERLQQLETQSS